MHKHLKFDKNDIKGEIDFGAVAKEVGFAKARQLLRQKGVKSHQTKIDIADHNVITSKKPTRLAEAIRMSNTLGNPPLDNPVEKIIEASNRLVTASDDQTEEEAARAFDTDVAIRRSMGSTSGELLLPQFNLDSLPAGIGDTLFFHTNFLRRLSCPRNSLITLVASSTVPQLSITHLRYIYELNLTSNKIVKLPVDFGVLKKLKTLKLADNSLSSFPDSFTRLTSLTDLDISRNNFATISPQFSVLSTLEKLNMNNNLFVTMQYGVASLKKLKYLDISYNQIPHLAILPPLMKPDALWELITDVSSGRYVYRNILTREKTKDQKKCTTDSIMADPSFHEFQHPKRAPLLYRRRKMWLSICQVHEWEPTIDPSTGLTYYVNNVSGMTQWEIPEVCDNIWRMESLETFKCTQNVITKLPPSIVYMKHLHLLSCAKNKISALPSNIGKLTSLHKCIANSNEMKLLPPSIVDCSNMVELNIEDNQIVRLPDLMGTMASLGKLNASSNRLRQFPFTFGYSKVLSALTIHENPLVDPPMDEVTKGLDSLKWYLRQRLMIEKRGYPPPMKFQQISIKEEVTIIHPEFVDRLHHLGEICMKTGSLNLRLLGLREIPRELFKLRKYIKRLQLDFNENLVLVSGFPIELASCKLISLKSCKMTWLPEMDNLKKLQTLNCDGNCFEELPSSFTTITTLTNVDLSNNCLYLLPEGFDTLTSLKYLNLEGNNLEEITDGIGSNRRLKVLNLSRNRFTDIPELLCQCKAMKKLNIEKNFLTKIPIRFSEMRLVELKIGHNLIDYIPDELFYGNLGKTLKLLSLSENNLMELPNSISELDENGFIDADYNPLVSPPPYLLSHGIDILIQYMKIRQKRLDEFADLMEEQDFSFVVENCSPIACEVLEDGTGFLTPQDLIEFDQATHEYLNYEYFKCPASGEEIVANITKLRDFREATLYSTILNTFIGVLQEILKTGAMKKLYSDAVIAKSEKPWGRKGEACSVYVVSLSALLRDTPSNYYQKNGRVSIINLVKDALPPMPFPFTVELFKDSLRLFVSPYGQVADTIQHTFSKCDCIDETKNNKPTRHSPCIKPAVCIVTSIYTDEEAERRDIEEDEYISRFEEIEQEIRIWILTKEGMKHQDMVVNKRKGVIRDEIRIRQEILRSETTKLNASKKELAALNIRKNQLEIGEEYAIHRFKTIEEAIEIIQKESDKISKVQDKVDLLTGQLNNLREKLNQEVSVFRKASLEDLIQKYCAIDYFDKIKKFRIYAIRNGLRRPWDGNDGALFEAWRVKLMGSTSTADMSLDDLINEDAKKAEEEEKANELAKQEEMFQDGTQNEELPPEYDFDGCEDMAQYDFLLWFRYTKFRQMMSIF